MRLLHTSDWHLGRTLGPFSRHAEQVAALDALVDVASTVDAVLISGDIFDSPNPPIAAEELFFDALARLGDRGRRAVVVIAGNHDAPDRILAPRALAAAHGALLFGRPGDRPRLDPGLPVRLTSAGSGRAELALPSGRLAVHALAFPSESRLRTIVAPDLSDEADARQRYAARVAAALAPVPQEPGLLRVGISHLHVTEATLGTSERAFVGGAWQVPASSLPAFDYLALGHVHRAQAVAPAAWYSGTPFALRMDERTDPHGHLLITAEPGAPPRVETVPCGAGRPLVRVEVPDVAAVCMREAELKGAYVEIVLSRPPPSEDLIALRKLPLDIVRVRVNATPNDGGPIEDRSGMSDEALFRLWVRETGGGAADESLVTLFLALMGRAP